MSRFSLILTAAFLTVGTSIADGQATAPEIIARARAIHERVITLDTHVDIGPANFTAERNYTQRLTTQVNLPKMVEGGLDVAFLIVYVGQDTNFTAEGYKRAYDQAIEKFEAIHRLTETIAPDKIGLALTPADVIRIATSGRKVAMIGIENAYTLGEDLKNIKAFYDRGGRYLSLAHNGHSQWSDSNTGEAQGFKWNGLSPLGRQAIAEMNRVGMMIDISHPSKQSSMQTFELSKAPVIASHSSSRAVADHRRNMTDEMLQALAKNGGVAMVNFWSLFLSNEYGKAARSWFEKNGKAFGELRAKYRDDPVTFRTELEKLKAQGEPLPKVPLSVLIDHIDHMVKVAGPDHVGLGSDFDGVDSLPEGLDGIDALPKITLELVKRGYDDQAILKILGGNFLRVFEAAEAYAKSTNTRLSGDGSTRKMDK